MHGTSNLDGQCCLSSGPRGVALIPTFSTTTDTEGVVVNLYAAGTARLNLRDGTPVTLTTDTEYPSNERIRITIDPAETKSFSVKVRIPAWCRSAAVEVNGRKVTTLPNVDGYVAIQRPWKKGDQIALRLKLEPRLILGEHTNLGKVALGYGPLVLAADESLISEASSIRRRGSAAAPQKIPLNAIAVASPKLANLKLTPEPAPDEFRTWPAAQVFCIRAVTRKPLPNLKTGTPLPIRLVPFADAGSTGARYKVWLPLSHELYRGNLLLDGKASRSRQENRDGSMTDEDFETFVTASDGKLAEEDWFAVALNEPLIVKRVLFAHGKTTANGGWFDATAGKPRIQVKRTKDGAWETVAELTNYPATTAKNSAEMEGGEHITCKLANPIKVWAIRVVGKPASGDNPQQSSSSCAELQAFSE